MPGRFPGADGENAANCGGFKLTFPLFVVSECHLGFPPLGFVIRLGNSPWKNVPLY